MFIFIQFALNPTFQDALLFCYLESAKRFLQQNTSLFYERLF